MGEGLADMEILEQPSLRAKNCRCSEIVNHWQFSLGVRWRGRMLLFVDRAPPRQSAERARADPAPVKLGRHALRQPDPGNRSLLEIASGRYPEFRAEVRFFGDEVDQIAVVLVRAAVARREASLVSDMT